MSDIFVSYASEDRKRILPLVRALEETGWSIFWDRTVPPGKTWRQVIGGEIESARCVVVVWSETSVRSEWVQEEAEVGRRKGILIPVLLDAVDPPFGFGSIQAAHLAAWEGDPSSPFFAPLRAAISAVLGPSPAEQTDEEHRQREKEARLREEARKAQEPVPHKAPSVIEPQPPGPDRTPEPTRRVSWFSSAAIILVILAVGFGLWSIQQQRGSGQREPERLAHEEEAAVREREVRIAELLELGRRAEAALRLTTPEHDNALGYYRETLQLDPANAAAQEGLRRIVEHYISLAGQALAQGRAAKAEEYLAKAASIDSDHPIIRELAQELKEIQRAPRKAKIVDLEMGFIQNGQRVGKWSGPCPDRIEVYADLTSDGSGVASYLFSWATAVSQHYVREERKEITFSDTRHLTVKTVAPTVMGGRTVGRFSVYTEPNAPPFKELRLSCSR